MHGKKKTKTKKKINKLDTRRFGIILYLQAIKPTPNAGTQEMTMTNQEKTYLATMIYRDFNWDTQEYGPEKVVKIISQNRSEISNYIKKNNDKLFTLAESRVIEA